MHCNMTAARHRASRFRLLITMPVMHQPTHATLLQPALDSATVISSHVWIFRRLVGIYPYFGHIFTAHAQKLLLGV